MLFNASHSVADSDGRMDELLLVDARLRNRAWLAGAALLVVAAGLVVGSDGREAAPQRALPGSAMLVPPRPGDVATLLKNTPLAIPPQDALALNAARPVDRVSLPAAKPFLLPSQEGAPAAALDCLTQAVYYEAAIETDTGQRAVAQVVLNRMRSPIFPHTVCGVVFQGSELPTGCQFSFTCDGSLARRPSLAGWLRARRIALAALSGHVERSVGLATHYHANYVVPYWASSLDKVSTIGAHIFYTMRGSLGRSAAFGARYDRLAEAAPAPRLGTDPIAELLLTDGAGGADVTGAEPRDRTVVQEDRLGAPAAAARELVAPVAPLRADEGVGEIVADQRKGQLARDP